MKSDTPDKPIHILLYTLMPTGRADAPIDRDLLSYLRNRLRRCMVFAAWKFWRVWNVHNSTFEDAKNTNRGDVAILVGVKRQLKLAFGNRALTFTEVAWGELASAIAEARHVDLIVIAGEGYLFADAEAGLPPRLAGDLIALDTTSCPVVALSIGVNMRIKSGDGYSRDGHFAFRASDHNMIRSFISRAAIASVRDHATQNALACGGLSPLPVIVDPGFLLTSHPRSDDCPRIDDMCLAVGLNVAFHGSDTAESSRRLLPLLVRALVKISAAMRCRFSYFVHSDGERGIARALALAGIHVDIIDGNSDYLLAHYSRMDIHISQMLHSAILAMSMGTPTLALAYDINSSAFFEQFGLADLCLDAATITEDDLLQGMKTLIAERQGIAAVIASRQKTLRAQAAAFYATIPALIGRRLQEAEAL